MRIAVLVLAGGGLLVGALSAQSNAPGPAIARAAAAQIGQTLEYDPA
jgi:uncharacterized protein YijF (DUF1287 family)